MLTILPQIAGYSAFYEEIYARKQSGELHSALLDTNIALLTMSIVSVINHPIDTFRKRLMLCGYLNETKDTKIRPFKYIINTYKKEGIRFMFNGISMSLIRSIVFFGLSWVKIESEEVKNILYGDSRRSK